MINMKLWIRSQDKMTLCKCNNIYIDDEWVGPYYIKDDTLTLGIYKTKERALEVLDEIQKMLDGRWIKEKALNVTMQDIFPIMFYEMPKE